MRESKYTDPGEIFLFIFLHLRDHIHHVYSAHIIS